MNKCDREALAAAIEQMRHESAVSAAQIDEKIRTEGWWDAGEFASYHRQCKSLHLKPWQCPPCWIDVDDLDAALALPPDHRGEREAAKLVQRLLRSGLSRFEPEPLAALERAEAEAAAPAPQQKRKPRREIHSGG